MPATRKVALTLLTMMLFASIASQAMAQPAKGPTKRDAAIEKCIKEAQSMQGTTPGNPDRVAHYKACMKASKHRP